MDVEELERLRLLKWAAEWAEKDAFAALAQSGDVAVREAAAELGISHRTIFAASRLVARFPPEERSLTHSPRTHARWLREDECKKN